MRPEGAAGPLELELEGFVSYSTWMLASSQLLMTEQQALLNTEPSSQALNIIFLTSILAYFLHLKV